VRILLQFRWRDVRLAFENLVPTESSEVVCQKGILERIWIPNVYIANEKHTLTVADMTEDLMVTVLPDGTVMLSVRCGSYIAEFLTIYYYFSLSGLVLYNITFIRYPRFICAVLQVEDFRILLGEARQIPIRPSTVSLDHGNL